MSVHWEHFVHQADMGVRGIAGTVAGAFEGAALALSAIVTAPANIRAREKIEIACDAPDVEVLLVDWLNAVIYEMAARGMLFSRFEVTMEGARLTGTAWGEPVDVMRHAPAVEPKGATYTELHVGQNDAGQWVAQCVVDV